MRVILSLLLAVQSAFAWGNEGHALIARIAWSQLTDTAKARVTAILGPGKTLPSIASWADEIRRARPETGPWHYIDIPIDQPHLDMARDCPKGDCVIAKIRDFEKVLHDPGTPDERRREALMFLVHFIGDMHQPLHCADNKDKGGNGVRLMFLSRPTNLHSIWDSGLLSRLAPEDQLFADYSAEALRNRKKYAKGSPTDWAEESHKLAVKIVYRKLPKVAMKTPDPEPISTDYEKVADPVVRRQIERAGDRLAMVLNRVLQDNSTGALPRPSASPMSRSSASASPRSSGR